VLYGATGYIGGLIARAIVAGGARPVLAGRDQGRLDALAERLSRNSDGVKLETAVAGSEGPGPLRELIGAGDVLVSTAGPFLKVGRSAVEAAVDAGAVYLDSAGEPPFIRQVSEEFGPRAERTGAVLLTAFGYDYVPGNLAGALALEAAEPAAARGTGGLLRAREHAEGGKRRHPRIGSRGAARTRVLVPWRARRAERTAARVASFEIDGSRRQAFSIGSSEHFALPRLRRQPPLTDVGVYLGRFGAATGLGHYASALATPLGRLARQLCAVAAVRGGPYFVPTMQRARPGILTLPSSS
jgi:hypothetical protein